MFCNPHLTSKHLFVGTHNKFCITEMISLSSLNQGLYCFTLLPHPTLSVNYDYEQVCKHDNLIELNIVTKVQISHFAQFHLLS